MIEIKQLRAGMKVRLIPRSEGRYLDWMKQKFLGNVVTISDVNYSRGYFHVAEYQGQRNWRWTGMEVQEIVEAPIEVKLDADAFDSFMGILGLACC